MPVNVNGRAGGARIAVPWDVSWATHGVGSRAPWKFSRWQIPVYNARKQLVVVEAGRGAGKDIVCFRAAVRDALDLYRRKKAAGGLDDEGAVMNPLVAVWLVSEQEKNLKQLRADARGQLTSLARACGVPPQRLFRYVARSDKFVVLGDGLIEIECVLSKHKDSLRGPGVDIVLWTEFAAVRREEAYLEELPGTLTRAGRAGIQYLNSSPKGVRGLYVDVFDGAKEDPDAAYFRATSYENDFLTTQQRATIAKEEKKLGWRYRRERLAERVEGGEGIDSFFEDVDRALRKAAPGFLAARKSPMTPREWGARGVLVGVDISRLGDDWTWFLAVDYETGWVLANWRKQTTRGPELVQMFETWHVLFGGPEFIMDATQHQAFVRDFLPGSIRVTEMKLYDRGKERLALNLKHLLEIGRVSLPDPGEFAFERESERASADELVRQLKVFEKKEVPNKPVKYEAPAGDHDDGVNALALAVEPIARSVGGHVDTEAAVGAFSAAVWG